jgi:hypothetical protein
LTVFRLLKDLPQPTLVQLRYYLRNYRELTIGTGAVTKEDIKNKIKENMFHPNIKEEQGFYFGSYLDSNGEPIVESTKFRVAFTSKKLLSFF